MNKRISRTVLLVCVWLCAHAASALRAQTTAPDSSAHFDKLASVPAYVLRTYHYAGAHGKTRVHVRCGLVNDVLQFLQTGRDKYEAAYEVNLVVVDREQNLAASRILKRTLSVDDYARTNDRQRLNEEVVDFLLASDAYELRVEISDLHTQRRLRRSYPLTLPDFNTPQLQLSTLAFGEKAEPRDSLRYNLLAVLSDNEPEQGVFFEIYGAQPGDTLRAHYRITDWKEATLEEWNSVSIADSSRMRRFEPLQSRLKYQGLHRLHVTLTVREQKTEAQADYRVQFAKPITIDTEAFLAEYSGLVYLPLRYIASKKEFQRLIAAPAEQRSARVENFWQERDPTVGTTANELREEFYRRVAFAQTRFALHGIDKAGWETDRGRIYIIYGPPQEVHQQMGELEPTPYEIWFYPTQEKRFVFMDKKGSGELELVNR